MEQRKLPRLTEDQEKRFRKLVLFIGYSHSPTEARKLTDLSSVKFPKKFLEVLDFIQERPKKFDVEDLDKRFGLEEMCEVFAVDDDVEDSNQIYDKGLDWSNCIYDKDEQSLLEPNCISDKVENGLEVSNQIYDKVLPSDDLPVVQSCSNEGNKPAELSNQIYDKRVVRGKQKEPLKTAILVRLDSIQLEELKALGGNTNEHIRRAISFYLDSVQNQTD